MGDIVCYLGVVITNIIEIGAVCEEGVTAFLRGGRGVVWHLTLIFRHAKDWLAAHAFYCFFEFCWFWAEGCFAAGAGGQHDLVIREGGIVE